MTMTPREAVEALEAHCAVHSDTSPFAVASFRALLDRLEEAEERWREDVLDALSEINTPASGQQIGRIDCANDLRRILQGEEP